MSTVGKPSALRPVTTQPMLPCRPNAAFQSCGNIVGLRRSASVLGCGPQTRLSTRLNAIAEPSSKEQSKALEVEIDNSSDGKASIVKVTGLNKPGLLSALTKTIQTLGLEVVKVIFLKDHCSLGLVAAYGNSVGEFTAVCCEQAGTGVCI